MPVTGYTLTKGHNGENLATKILFFQEEAVRFVK